jgi:hypothetical protein
MMKMTMTFRQALEAAGAGRDVEPTDVALSADEQRWFSVFARLSRMTFQFVARDPGCEDHQPGQPHAPCWKVISG